jgi:hypothetical protein
MLHEDNRWDLIRVTAGREKKQEPLIIGAHVKVNIHRIRPNPLQPEQQSSFTEGRARAGRHRDRKDSTAKACVEEFAATPSPARRPST